MKFAEQMYMCWTRKRKGVIKCLMALPYPTYFGKVFLDIWRVFRPKTHINTSSIPLDFRDWVYSQTEVKHSMLESIK